VLLLLRWLVGWLSVFNLPFLEVEAKADAAMQRCHNAGDAIIVVDVKRKESEGCNCGIRLARE
jgi:hypothetical protein